MCHRNIEITVFGDETLCDLKQGSLGNSRGNRINNKTEWCLFRCILREKSD